MVNSCLFRIRLCAYSGALIFVAPFGAQAQEYTFTDLGTLGGATSYASRMSADGSVIAGRSATVGGQTHAFLWENGVMTDLGTLGGATSDAYAVSEDGSVIAGESRTAGNQPHAFRWASGIMTDLGTLGGNISSANAMSADGSIIAGGGYIAGNAAQRAFRWENGVMTSLGTLGGSNSYALAMSADGSVIAGESYISGFNTHAFRWQGGVMTDIGTLGGTLSYFRAMSENGAVIAGESRTAGNQTHAYRWQGGVMTDLGTLGGTYSSASAMSADGSVIAGTSSVAGGQHAFRWEGGVMTDLGTLGGTSSSATVMSADGSVIAGTSYTAGNVLRGYLWTEDDGMVELLSLFSDPSNWSDNTSVSRINSDGTVLIGNGTYSGSQRAFLLSAPTGGIITPEELAASLAGVASSGPQAYGISSGLLGQSMFAARNAISGYLHQPAATPFASSEMSFGLLEPRDIAPAAGEGGTLSEQLYAFYAVGSFGLGSSSNDFDNTNTGGNTGILVKLDDDLAVGAGIVGARNEQDTQLGGSNRIDAIGGTVIAAFEPPEGFRAYATATTATLNLDTDRNYTSGGGVATSSGETDGVVYGVAGRIAYAVPVHVVPTGTPVDLIPFVEAEWSHVSLDGYSESGGPFDANIADQSADSFISRIGAEVEYEASEALTLRGRAAWGHFYSGNDDVVASISGLSLSIDQDSSDSNWAETGVSALWRVSERTTFTTDLTARTGEAAEPALNLTVGVTMTLGKE